MKGDISDDTAQTGRVEMTGSLLAWGAVRAVDPDANLAPGVHGPVAGFGLEAVLQGAAAAGLEDVTGELSPGKNPRDQDEGTWT
jgi:hypothetical protein